MTRQEPEWRIEDIALLLAEIDRQAEADQPTSFGIPVTEAYDSDTDPDNPRAPFVLEVYSYTDHAARVVRRAREDLESQHGDGAADDRVFFVKKAPNPNPLAATG